MKESPNQKFHTFDGASIEPFGDMNKYMIFSRGGEGTEISIQSLGDVIDEAVKRYI